MNKNTSKQAPRYISELAKGDRVIFISSLPGAWPMVASVERTTATEVVVCGTRFSRHKELRAVSSSVFMGPTIWIGKPDELDEDYWVQQQVAKLRSTDWEKLSAPKIDRIVRELERMES